LVVGALFSFCLATVPAEATVDHTYVSGKGTDTGGCISPSIACRTFAYAITQTAASGTIIVIDPADYAPVTITKSISIIADGGGPGVIIAAAGNAITISAGANDIVNLRGLTLDGDGTATDGILINSAGSVTISDCLVRSFQTGILINGILEQSLNISILNSVMNNNGTGLTISGSGFLKTFLTVRKSVANYNIIGFSVTGATLTLAGSMATGNSQAGILIGPVTGDVSHSQVLSYGDNEIDNNGTNVSGGTLAPVAKR
jgi:hypothetical protein